MSSHIGFTGTREGMTPHQKNTVRGLLYSFFVAAPVAVPLVGKDAEVTIKAWFHHGDCIGADHQAAEIAREIGFRIYGHPPDKEKYRSHFASDFDNTPKHYYTRNRDIVILSDLLIATPAAEGQTGGTWYTWDFAAKNKKPRIMVHSDGTLTVVKEKV